MHPLKNKKSLWCECGLNNSEILTLRVFPLTSEVKAFQLKNLSHKHLNNWLFLQKISKNMNAAICYDQCSCVSTY